MNGLMHALLGAIFPPAPEPLDEVEQGRVAVVRGRVVPRDLMRSPLTQEQCVYYRYTVEDWRRSAFAALAGDGFWQLTEQDEAIVEFYLQDADRRAVVSPFSAQVEPRRGVTPRPVALDTSGRRAHELLIRPGDWIEVVGEVDRVDDLFDDGRDYRGSPGRLCLRAPTGGPLLVRILHSDRAWLAASRPHR
ncbi:MAG TPA: hypothetical protein VMZ28_23605 [Kofleriaceae bacterium]|nr:hypothetical protein [Kofleriaceae bacterium]